MKEPSSSVRSRRRIVLGVLIGLVVVLALSCGGLLVWANGVDIKHWGPFTSVEKLLEKMPCFAGLEIESTTFQGRARWRRVEVPGMGMTWYETWGELKLTEGSAAALRTGYSWREVARGDLPSIVRELGPEGERFFVSDQFNEKFEHENRSAFRNGFVMVEAGSDWGTVYFLVRDEDHPIDAVFH